MTRAVVPDLPARADFAAWWPTQTRWADNDQYGHANNVVYYSWFDTAVNGLLMQRLGCDVRDLPAIGVVAETSCRFLAQVGFPQQLEVGLAVDRLGTEQRDLPPRGVRGRRVRAGRGGALRARVRRPRHATSGARAGGGAGRARRPHQFCIDRLKIPRGRRPPPGRG